MILHLVLCNPRISTYAVLLPAPPACSGRPVADFSLKSAPPAIRLFMRGVMLGALACFIPLPWAAMAASGTWQAGLTYFLPNMVMTVANIVVEQLTWHAGKPLAVYASTNVNNLVRLIVSVAGEGPVQLQGWGCNNAVHRDRGCAQCTSLPTTIALLLQPCGT